MSNFLEYIIHINHANCFMIKPTSTLIKILLIIMAFMLVICFNGLLVSAHIANTNKIECNETNYFIINYTEPKITYNNSTIKKEDIINYHIVPRLYEDRKVTLEFTLHQSNRTCNISNQIPSDYYLELRTDLQREDIYYWDITPSYPVYRESPIIDLHLPLKEDTNITLTGLVPKIKFNGKLELNKTLIRIELYKGEPLRGGHKIEDGLNISITRTNGPIEKVLNKTNELKKKINGIKSNKNNEDIKKSYLELLNHSENLLLNEGDFDKSIMLVSYVDNSIWKLSLDPLSEFVETNILAKGYLLFTLLIIGLPVFGIIIYVKRRNKGLVKANKDHENFIRDLTYNSIKKYVLNLMDINKDLKNSKEIIIIKDEISPRIEKFTKEMRNTYKELVDRISKNNQKRGR